MSKSRPNEIQITRIYDAPISVVWDAWTDPVQAAKWWGPRGFTITTHSKELKVGGIWHYTMHGPDGTDYPNKTVYLEIEKNARLVYDHGGYDDRPPLFRVTVNFSETKGKTKMDMSMAFDTAETAIRMKKFIKDAGGNGTWDRLAEYLEKNSTSKEIFIINRTFEAPIEIVYDAWTNPEHLVRWLSPTGTTMKFFRADLKVGGSAFYTMFNDSGMKLFGRTHYLEMNRPNRLVYSQQFCDENEKISRHPMAPTWPETMLTTVTFSEEDEGQTRVTVQWEPYGSAAAEEITAFVQAKGGMTQGWSGSFDKLDSFLTDNKR